MLVADAVLGHEEMGLNPNWGGGTVIVYSVTSVTEEVNWALLKPATSGFQTRRSTMPPLTLLQGRSILYFCIAQLLEIECTVAWSYGYKQR